MFGCKKCQALEDEVKFLRETNEKLRASNEKLVDRLMAVADVKAFAAVEAVSTRGNGDSRFYGGPNDEMIEHDEVGRTVLVQET